MATENTKEGVTRIPVPGKDRGGKWIVFGLEEYRVPPLGFGAIRDLQESVGILQNLGSAPSPEQMSVIADVVHRAMVRNYPALTKEEVTDMLDIENFAEALTSILGMSGFVKKEGASGEA